MSILGQALAQLCGTEEGASREGNFFDVLESGGLRAYRYHAEAGITNRELADACRQAVEQGLVVADREGRLVGRLFALTCTSHAMCKPGGVSPNRRKFPPFPVCARLIAERAS